MIKNVKHVELNINYCDCFLEYANFKDDLIEHKCLCYNKKYQEKFGEKLKKQCLIYINFLTTTIISLFYCCKKLFILMNILMIGKISMKNHYLKKKILQSL